MELDTGAALSLISSGTIILKEKKRKKKKRKEARQWDL